MMIIDCDDADVSAAVIRRAAKCMIPA